MKTSKRERYEIKTITMVDGWSAVYEMSKEDYGPGGPGPGYTSCGKYKSYPIVALAVADLVISHFHPETGVLLRREELGPDIVGVEYGLEPGFSFSVVDEQPDYQGLLDPGTDLKSWIDFNRLGSK